MKYKINGEIFNPIKMGDPEDWYEDEPKDSKATCGDCGAHIGKYHQDGCDIERCPKCHGQLISCDCGEIEVINDGGEVNE